MGQRVIYLKVGALVIFMSAVGWAFYATYHAGKKAGSDAIQKLWDEDKAKIQATADAAIAQATKDKETAIAANEVIANDYQAQLLAANASAAQFAQRLRNAEAIIAAGGGSSAKAPDKPGSVNPGSPAVAELLGQLVTLVTDLRTDCKADADQLDALIAQLKPQL